MGHLKGVARGSVVFGAGLTWAVFAFGGLGCASQPKQETKAPLGARVDRIIPQAESLDTTKVLVRLAVENPRKEPVKILRIDYTLDTADVAGVVNGTSESGATLEAGQSADLDFVVLVELPKDKERYMTIVERGTFPLKLQGNVFFGDGSALPFDRQADIPTPLLPKLVVHDAQVARYGEEGLDVTVFLRMANDNNFSVTVEGLEYTLYVEDKKVKSEQAVGVTLVPGSAQEFEVSTVLDKKRFGDIKGILDRRLVNYRVEGRVSQTKLDIPFDHSGEIKFADSE